VWISIEQSTAVSGIVYVFMGFVVHDWSCAIEFTNYGAPTVALTTIGRLISFPILLVELVERCLHVKSFLTQTTHSIVSRKRPVYKGMLKT